ncbi:TPA: hypothetical protein ACQ30S_004214 [Yersinia enterocolitica]
MKNGIRITTENWPWKTHAEEIARQQRNLKGKMSEYDKSGCNDHLPNAFNRRAAERMTDNNFNPRPNEWLGPNHPACNGLGDLIRENATPELPIS